VNTVQADKELLKKLIILAGKAKVDLARHFIRDWFEYPCDSILIGIATALIGPDERAFTIYFRIKLGQRYRGFKTVIDYLSNENLENLKNELEKCVGGLPDWFVDALRGLIDLSRDPKFQLDRKKDLSDIDPDELYGRLRSIRGFGGEEVPSWVICELCRIWNLRFPSDLSLSPSTKERLQPLGLSENDFNCEDFPYVDAAMFALKRDP